MKISLSVITTWACYPEYRFEWCNSWRRESCVHTYIISASHFQRKLTDYYDDNRRPPLTEAFFYARLPRVYQDDAIKNGCIQSILLGLLLASETSAYYDLQQAWDFFRLSEFFFSQQYKLSKELLENEHDPWRYKKAKKKTTQLLLELTQKYQEKPKIRYKIGFVVAHCRETLSWIEKDLFPLLDGQLEITLHIYEKCGEFESTTAYLKKIKTDLFNGYLVDYRVAGDECSAYLAHILRHYDSQNFDDYTFFVQGDADEHVRFEFLKIILSMLAQNTFSHEFFYISSTRHALLYSPCLGAIHELLFGSKLEELIGPYCCAHFLVSKKRILARKRGVYEKMMGLVDGQTDFVLCDNSKGVSRSSYCLSFELFWHVVFGEKPETPLRPDDVRLELPLRQKHGNDITRDSWNDVVMWSLNPMKIAAYTKYEGNRTIFIETYNVRHGVVNETKKEEIEEVENIENIENVENVENNENVENIENVENLEDSIGDLDETKYFSVDTGESFDPEFRHPFFQIPT